jgi:hypothetical protein
VEAVELFPLVAVRPPQYACGSAATEIQSEKIGEEDGVHYGVSVPNFGVGVDARAITELAREAEEAGWDGFFLWDHLLAFSPGSVPVVDPWVALTAVALTAVFVKVEPDY